MQIVYYLVDISRYNEYTEGLEGGLLGMAARAVFLAERGETMCVRPTPNRTICALPGRYLSVQ